MCVLLGCVFFLFITSLTFIRVNGGTVFTVSWVS
jgi:hypothetical protein